MSTPAGGAGSGRDWLSNIPLEIQQLIISFLPPEVIANPEGNITLINHVFKQVMNKQMTWDILAKTWKIEIEKPKTAKDVKPTKEAQDALFKLTKAAVLAHLKQVTDLAMGCVTDPEVRAKIEKHDPLARYALIQQWAEAHPVEALGFLLNLGEQYYYLSKEEQLALSSPLFTRSLFEKMESIEQLRKRVKELQKAGLEPNFDPWASLNNAASFGLTEIVKILLTSGFKPNLDILQQAVSSKDSNTEIVQMLLNTGMMEELFFMHTVGDVITCHQLFMRAIHKEDLNLISTLINYGLVPLPITIEYARTKVKENPKWLPFFDKLLGAQLDFLDRKSIENYIKKRWGRLSPEKVIDKLIRAFKLGKLIEFFPGADVSFLRESPLITQIILDILKRGNIKTKQMDEILHLAAKNGFTDLIRSVLQSDLIKPDYQIPYEAIVDAIHGRHLDTMDMLLTSGRIKRPPIANPIIYLTIQNGDEESIRLLLQTGLFFVGFTEADEAERLAEEYADDLSRANILEIIRVAQTPYVDAIRNANAFGIQELLLVQEPTAQIALAARAASNDKPDDLTRRRIAEMLEKALKS